jgi:iron complex outermembrane receptor protein
VSYLPYSIIDLKAIYQLGQTDLYLDANNLFNNTHVDIGNIPQPGFWLSGGISIALN